MSTNLLAFLLAAGAIAMGATGCQSAPSETVVTSEENIVDGQPSGPGDDSVIKLEALDAAGIISNCTGTLVAPNLVLTVRHCVAAFSAQTFTCDSDGNLTSGTGGNIGILDLPSNVSIKSGETPTTKAVAKGVQIFAAETNTICRNDFALVLIDKQLDQAPYSLPISPVRLYAGVDPGEQFRMAGYGQIGPITKDSGLPTRHTRGGLTVAKVGSSAYRNPGDKIPPRTFTSDGPAGCPLDSGGPTFADSGAITGVFSQYVGDCLSPLTVNYFTQVAPFRDEVVLPAFKAAGYEPWLESNSEPGLYGTGGSAGTGGAAPTGGMPGSGGAPNTEAGGTASTTITGASGGATSVTPSATGGAPIGGAPASTIAAETGGDAAAIGGAAAQTGGSSAEVVVYDRGPSKGGSCGCRVGGPRGYGVGAIAVMAMVLGARRRTRRNPT